MYLKDEEKKTIDADKLLTLDVDTSTDKVFLKIKNCLYYDFQYINIKRFFLSSLMKMIVKIVNHNSHPCSPSLKKNLSLF